MLLEFARHDDLVRRIERSELPAAAIGGPVAKAYNHAPLAADPEVSGPVRLAIVLGMAPPALHLVSGERAVDAFWWPTNHCGCDDRASDAIGDSARRLPFRLARRPEIGVVLLAGRHLGAIARHLTLQMAL